VNNTVSSDLIPHGMVLPPSFLSESLSVFQAPKNWEHNLLSRGSHHAQPCTGYVGMW